MKNTWPEMLKIMAFSHSQGPLILPDLSSLILSTTCICAYLRSVASDDEGFVVSRAE